MSDVRPVLELRNLSFSYGGAPVLLDINLTVFDRDYMVILGPNGGGKTTLAGLMLGLLQPQQGEVLYHLPDLKHRIGYVPQHSSFEKWFPLSVEQVVRTGLQFQRGLMHPFRREDRVKVAAVLEKLKLKHLAKERIGVLSGGQMQRVLTARALIADPKLLLLDEPTASIDSTSRTQLGGLLTDLNQKIPIVIITHDMTAVAADVNRIACVNQKLYLHRAGELTGETIEKVYGCPVELLAHGVPHRVLGHHHETEEEHQHD